MKSKLYLLVTVALLLSYQSFSQCAQNIVLSTQAQVDSFPATYSCSELTGSLTIQGTGITNIDSLYQLTSVKILTVSGTGLTDFDGLQNLTSIGATLIIEDNLSDLNIDALQNLASFGDPSPGVESIRIKGNLFLHHLNAFSNISSLPGDLNIIDNYGIEQIEGLRSLQSVRSIKIDHNTLLYTLKGLRTLTSVRGSIIITNNPTLTAVDGFLSLTHIDNISDSSRMIISSNDAITTLDGLFALRSLDGANRKLIVTDNLRLASGCGIKKLLQNNLGCSACTPTIDISNNTSRVTREFILANCQDKCDSDIDFDSQLEVDAFPLRGCSIAAGYVTISGSDITNLDSLRTLTSVAGNMQIRLTGLTDLDGLEQLQSISGMLVIESNAVLNNVDALSNLTSVGNWYVSSQSVTVESNPKLKRLTGFSGLRTLSGHLSITNNDALKNLHGLDSITSANGLSVSGNDVLENIDALGSFTKSTGYLQIELNPKLTNIDGLHSFTTLESTGPYSSIGILYNATLTNLDGLASFQGFHAPQNYLTISENPMLTDACAIYPLLRDNLGCDPCGRYINISNNGPGVTQDGILINCVNDDNRRCDINFTLTTQAQVDAFKSTYGCKVVDGYVLVTGEDITNIDSLSVIEKVSHLNIIETNITNLDGLSSLTAIDGGLVCVCGEGGLLLRSNPLLNDLGGLSSLTRLEGTLQLSKLPALEEITGFEGLDSIGGNLYLNELPNVTSLEGFSNLTTLGTNHPELTRLAVTQTGVTNLHGLEGLTRVDGIIHVTDNPKLKNLDGLNNITHIGRTDEQAGGGLGILDNPELLNIEGLSSLTTVVSGIQIDGNTRLKNIDGLRSLTVVGGGNAVADIFITSNDSLTNVDGLSSLTTIQSGSDLNPRIALIQNKQLTSYCGLYTIVAGTGFQDCNGTSCQGLIVRENALNITRQQIIDNGPCSDETDPDQPTNIAFADITDTTMTVTFTGAAHADGYVAVMRSFESSYPDDVPVQGHTYHVGEVIGYSSIVVSVSTDTVLNIVYLNPDTEYWFDIYSYNYDGSYHYVTTSPLEGMQRTLQSGALAAWPNPFVDRVTIPFSTSANDNVRVVIFDSVGANIAEVANDSFEAGSHEVVWNGVDRNGNNVPGGTYYYHVLKANGTIRGRLTK